jgi:hypothetical protein
MNVLKALDENLDADLAEATADAALALERYVAAQRRISELRSLLDLRKAMTKDSAVIAAISRDEVARFGLSA